MAIIRIEHNQENPFVQLNKKALWDERLSLKAIGLWARCMSRPADWRFNVKELASKSKEGRRAIDSAINELIEFGYAVRLEHWEKSDDGKFTGGGIEYVFFEFVATQEDKDRVLENFKKFYRHCGFGDCRNGDCRNDELLIKNLTKTDREVVCVAAPPVAAPPRYEKVEKEDFQGKNFSISRDDITSACVMHRMDWTPQEIEMVWEVLVKYSSPIRDWFSFCEGTINNHRKINKIKSLSAGEYECKPSFNSKKNKDSKPTSKTTNSNISDPATWGRPLANFKFPSGPLPEYLPI